MKHIMDKNGGISRYLCPWMTLSHWHDRYLQHVVEVETDKLTGAKAYPYCNLVHELLEVEED